MKKLLGTFLFVLASSALKGLRANPAAHMELTKLKMSLLYVKSIKTFRLLFMSLLSMGVCLVFLLMGLILFHASVFLYAPWSMGTKMFVGLGFSLAYLLGTAFIFAQVFASDKWLKIFHAEAMIDHLHKEASPKEETNPVEK
jgi:hypothetical protein